MISLFLIALVVVGCNQSADSVTLKEREIERQNHLWLEEADPSNLEEYKRVEAICESLHRRRHGGM